MDRTALAIAIAALLLPLGCRDISGFNTGGDSYVGPVVEADFVRVGIAEGVELCLTLDTDRLQDAPGAVSSNDGMFKVTPLRPIPQIWHDPLSTLNFGDGRVKNLVYVATAHSDGGIGGDLFVVISLMNSGRIEVRLLQGAPQVAVDGGPPSTPNSVFAVFTLNRQSGPCPF